MLGFTFDVEEPRFASGVVWLSGLAAGVPRVLRPVVYRRATADEPQWPDWILVCSGPEVVHPVQTSLDDRKWRTYELDRTRLIPGSYFVAMFGGPIVGDVAAFTTSEGAFAPGDGSGLQWLPALAGDPPQYADHPIAVAENALIATTGNPRPLMNLIAVPEYEAPDVDELALSRQPWEVTQRIFAGAPLKATRAVVRAGWHGTILDTEDGAVCVVRDDGPLADLVGQRLRVRRRARSGYRTVYLYVHRAMPFPDAKLDEDVSLPRRPWLALERWAKDGVPVIVEAVA